MGVPKVSPSPTPRGLFIFLPTRYYAGMNELLTLSPELSSSRGLTLILTADKARAGITELIAARVLLGSLFVIAGSEWLPAFELTRTIRRKTLHVKQALDHLRVARTSTCYRLLDTIVNIPPPGEPILVLDFLHTFYDADIPLRVRLLKLRECCRHLKLLANERPVIVITQEMPVDDYEKFSPALFSVADRTLYLEPKLEQIIQSTLF